MPKVSFVGDNDLIGALSRDIKLPLSNRERLPSAGPENDRLGLELGSVEMLIGHIAAGVELIVIARHLLEAARASKRPKLEITSPNGRMTIDLTGKTDEEVVAAVKGILPFAR
jgi:hypothetical protein